MEDIRLISPSIEYDEDIMKFRAELLEARDKDSFAGCLSLRESLSTKEWLQNLLDMENEETCPKGLVTSSTYIAVRNFDNRIVGIIDLRHHINNPVLSLWGGHIGYSIRPSERNKGYGKAMLALNLKNCKKRNMDKIMVSCARENKASEKVIIACGGIFEKEVEVDGEYIKRYWITL